MDSTIWAKAHGATTHFPFALTLISGALDAAGFALAGRPAVRDLNAAGYWTILLAALGSVPDGAVGARFYLPGGSSVTFTVIDTAPTSPPAAVFTISQAGSGPNWDEALSGGQMIYVTALSGGPLFRWF